ncbi:glycosyltransferase family 39 protein [Candidatus Giovannonibacteria bacterium]|nr:glycosyltransferase family 39 protein [Candidatus Giovannonibacteria bacterium]
MSGKKLLAIIAIMSLAIFLRFWMIWEIPPGLYPDEAMNGNNATEALSSGEFKAFYPDNNGREGLFINIQAFSISMFGHEPWALRIVSAIFGTLTVLGLFFLARAMFYNSPDRDRISLLASFFLATSFWHVNFSRIGFRAIMAPFFLVWGLYFLFRIYKDIGTSKTQIISAAAGGLLFGLGFHSYIAYRILPLLMIFPIVRGWKKERRDTCSPCLSLIYVLFVLIAVIPLGLYFSEHPDDILGRTSQISIFSSDSPVQQLLINSAKTVGMFWFYGDFNWRHNYSGSPQLSLVVGILFFIGILVSLRSIKKFSSWFLFIFFALSLLPVVISSEGLPHALRSIISIIPAVILSSVGMNYLINLISVWIAKKRDQFPKYANQLLRIKREMLFLLALLLVSISTDTYDKYFNNWSQNGEVYAAFAARDWEMAMYLKSLPDEVNKYVVITGERLDGRIVSISSQSVLYGTNTFLPEERTRKNYHYVTPDGLEKAFEDSLPEKAVIVFLNTENKGEISYMLKKYKDMKITVHGAFIALSLTSI